MEEEEKKDDAAVEPAAESKEEESEGEYIVPPIKVVTDDKKDDEEDEEEAESEKKEETSSEDESIEVDGVKYSKEELDQIFAVGKTVKEYQKEHPGYDPILIHKDYTKKSQELAEAKRQTTVQKTEQPQQKPNIDLSKFKKEDVDYFEQLASALGYAKAKDLEEFEKKTFQRTYDSVKKEEISVFLESHPEYKPQNDKDDLRWNALKAEFDLYKLPEDPKQLGKLLERAHGAIAGSQSSVDSKKLSEILAKKRASGAAQTSSGGGGAGGGAQASKPKSKKMESLSALAAAGGLKGYSKEELEEMFS